MGLGLALGVLGAPLLVTLLAQARCYARAAAARTDRRDGCPFEDDDDTVRSPLRQGADVVAETVAIVRLALRGLRRPPRAWQVPAPGGPSGAAILVLLPERRFGAASLVPLGSRLRDALGVTVYVEPRGRSGATVDARVERLADFVDALHVLAPTARIVLLGHGAGGLVAHRHLDRSGARDRIAQVVTLASDHSAPAAGHCGWRTRVLSIYSLHDAVVVPPSRGYLAGAFNIALRDVGHYGLALAPRTLALLVENLADVCAPATKPPS